MKILEELGFEVSEDIITQQQYWIEESDTSRAYVEGYPFYMLLCEIGCPEYDENWERGRGILHTNFVCNGYAYDCSLIVRKDWLSAQILEYINDFLKQQNIEKQIYYCEDGGQGAILFYRDADWAKQFELLTGISLNK